MMETDFVCLSPWLPSPPEPPPTPGPWKHCLSQTWFPWPKRLRTAVLEDIGWIPGLTKAARERLIGRVIFEKKPEIIVEGS